MFQNNQRRGTTPSQTFTLLYSPHGTFYAFRGIRERLKGLLIAEGVGYFKVLHYSLFFMWLFTATAPANLLTEARHPRFMRPNYARLPCSTIGKLPDVLRFAIATHDHFVRFLQAAGFG